MTQKIPSSNSFTLQLFLGVILLCTAPLFRPSFCLASEDHLVTIYLGWKHQFQFTGYYGDEGLHVQLKAKHPDFPLPARPPTALVYVYDVADTGLQQVSYNMSPSPRL